MTTKQGSALEFVNTRLFSVPRARLFEAFSDPKQLALWWGPEGFTNTFQEFDLRPGGNWRFVMRSPGGADYENESVFVEVVRPERIVFDHLRTMHRYWMTMTFAEQGGKTQLTWVMRFEDAQEYEKLKQFIPKANEQNFDRLEAHLAKESR